MAKEDATADIVVRARARGGLAVLGLTISVAV